MKKKVEKMEKPEKLGRKDVYQIVTERIVEMLEKGVVPWRHFAKHPLPGHQDAPRNLVSKKAYQGTNVLLLACSGYPSPYWLTPKQCKDLGGTPKEGQKADYIVVYWKILEMEDRDEEGKMKKIPFLRYSSVYNASQCDGLKDPSVKQTADAIKEEEVIDPDVALEAIVAGMPDPPKIVIDNITRAFYRADKDMVHMLERNKCKSGSEYYSTLLHELVHSTALEKRLNRGTIGKNGFGGAEYAKEELVAEMGAAMLMAEAGKLEDTVENNTAYIQSWLKALKNDSTMVVWAASRAAKAATYIMNGNGKGHEVPEK